MRKSILGKLTIIAIIIAFGTNCAKAQTNFSIHAGLASPLNSSANSLGALLDIEDYELMGSGFNAGMKINFGIPAVKGLSIIGTADFFYNVSDKDAKNVNSPTDSCSTTHPKHINIPIMIGVNYEYGVTDAIKLWGEGTLGFNVGMMTKYYDYHSHYDYDYDSFYSYSSQEESTYKPNVSLAFQIGAGVMLSDKFSIGAHYYSFVGQRIKGDGSYNDIQVGTDNDGNEWINGPYGGEGTFDHGSITSSMFVIRAGFHF